MKESGWGYLKRPIRGVKQTIETTNHNIGESMDNELMKQMAKELATKINAMVNIPLVSEENEQAFFEMVILMLLDLVISRLGKSYR